MGRASSLVYRGFAHSLRIFTVLFLIVPLIVVIGASFNPLRVVFPPEGFSLHWYEVFFSRPEFMNGFRISIMLGAVAVAVSLPVGAVAAYAMTRYRFRGNDLSRTLALTPLIVPGVVSGFALFTYFRMLGVSAGFTTLALAHVVLTIPFAVRVMSASFYGLDRSVEEAAQNLGATPTRTFIHIVLPLAKPGLISAAVFAFAISFNEIAATSFLITPGVSTLQVELFLWMRLQIEPTVAAASTILALYVIGIVLVIERAVGLEKFLGFSYG